MEKKVDLKNKRSQTTHPQLFCIVCYALALFLICNMGFIYFDQITLIQHVNYQCQTVIIYLE